MTYFKFFILLTSLALVACPESRTTMDAGIVVDSGPLDSRPLDSGRPDSTCFAAGTQIATPFGTVPIEHLEVGDQVMAYDHSRETEVVSRVTQTFIHEDVVVSPLQVSHGATLWVTAEHPIYLAGEAQYAEARHLGAGVELLLLHSDGIALATLTEWGPPTSVPTVYNIEVESHHNYFAEGVLVHNKSDAAAADVPDVSDDVGLDVPEDSSGPDAG